MVHVEEELCIEFINDATNADEWLQKLTAAELENWLYFVDLIDVDEKAGLLILYMSLALYAREIGVFDFDADEKLCKTVMGRLIANLVLEEGRRQGKYEISHPLYLYKAEGTIKAKK